MPLFLLGLSLGAISGAATYVYSGETQLAVIAAIITAVITWCSVAIIAILDD
ncbi:hypothetical protein [Streptomyces sp. NBC_01718]|uniref:hypothetical protein n=1 Tax=Streptomyces sp. NBC_01718 TaxID=2975919 RepID=UPI00352E2A52